jgi:hypothetical protein
VHEPTLGQDPNGADFLLRAWSLSAKKRQMQTKDKQYPPEEEQRLFSKFCQDKAVNNTHPLLNWVFGFLPVLFALSVLLAMKLQLYPSPEGNLETSTSHEKGTPRVPTIIDKAVPGFLLSIVVERLVVFLNV